MIEVINLTKQYDGFKAVDNLNFEVKPGKITVLLGPNGDNELPLQLYHKKLIIISSFCNSIVSIIDRQNRCFSVLLNVL